MTHTDQHTQSPGAPPGERPRTRSVSLRAFLGSAGAVATVAGVAVLGVLTMAVDDENEATARPPVVEPADGRATQGPVQDRRPAASASVSGGAPEHERFAKCVEAEIRSRAAISTSDDGLPNPWEVGNIAAKCHLERSHQHRDTRDP